MITQDRLKELIHYDPVAGIMKWIKHEKRPDMVGKRLGSIDNNGYVKVWVDGKQYRVHRLAFLYMNGSIPDLVDHRDGVGANNRWKNLRAATKTTNAQNIKKAKADSSHGFLGVYKQKGKFIARITVNGSAISLGSYETPESAHSAYLTAKRKLHEGNTL